MNKLASYKDRWFKSPRSFSHTQLLIFALFFALVGGFLLYKSFALNPNLPGDVNNDNTVNITDLSILLSNYNTNYPAADFNSDGTVSILDLSVLLSNYGRSYTATPPTVSLSANPTTITSGSSSSLSWSSTNATSCTASGAWTGSKATSGTQSVTPTATSTYTLSCTGAGGTANKSVTVTVGAVNPPPPPPPSGGGATITGSQCNSLAAVSSAVIQNYTVNGSCSVSGTNVTFNNVTFTGTIDVGNGTVVTNSRAMGFNSFGKDNWRLEGNFFDGKGIDNQNIIWDEPAGVTSDNWIIRNNTFQNFYLDDGQSHSEALYIGYSTHGLVEGNTFTNNGNTAHIFFTTFGNQFDNNSYPRYMCVRSNNFGPTHTAYYDVQVHASVPNQATTQIYVQADASIGANYDYHGTC
ncbi:MAG TPA: dockerin type I domain-containing protein [Candidatus Saccharimonadales bacterium]|nr:dockerin type I domain-containing protein [Candidatus Saccharimonadales bacterium]